MARWHAVVGTIAIALLLLFAALKPRDARVDRPSRNEPAPVSRFAAAPAVPGHEEAPKEDSTPAGAAAEPPPPAPPASAKLHVTVQIGEDLTTGVADVLCFPDEKMDGQPRRAKSGEDGTCEIEVPPGEWYLIAVTEAMLSGVESKRVEAGEEDDVYLRPQACVIVWVRVTDLTGASLQGVSVGCEDPWDAVNRTETDGAGAYRLLIPTSNTTMIYRMAGFGTGLVGLDLEGGDRTVRDVRLASTPISA